MDPEVSLTRQFGGFSPFLSKEVEYRMAHGQSFSSIMQEIASSDQLYVYESDGEPQFHCIPLTHLGRCRQYGIFEGFDVLYYHREEKERIRQMNGDVFRFVRKETWQWTATSTEFMEICCIPMEFRIQKV